MKDLIFKDIDVAGYERVVEIKNPRVGLHAILAFHNTTLGPALGGIRVYPYTSFDHALNDVLRLSKGMTYKAAVSETGTGGGKSVIITSADQPKTDAIMLSFADAVNSLNGKYICAVDFGTDGRDLQNIRKKTPFVVGFPDRKSSGDPSRFTAFGGFLGVKALVKKVWGQDSVEGRTIAIQGLGSVGMRLADHLFWDGAKLIVTDINPALISKAEHEYNAQAVAPDEIYSVKCDVFSPCALGGILNSKTIPLLNCRGVAGVANNQLLTEDDGNALFKRGILYAPDFVINAGGLLNVCAELFPSGYNAYGSYFNVRNIYDRLLKIFDLSEQNQKPCNIVANELAEYNIKHGVGKRVEDVIFHH